MPTAVDENKEGECESGDGTPNLPSNTAEAPHLLEQTVGGALEVPPLQTIYPPSQFAAAASGKSAVDENKEGASELGNGTSNLPSNIAEAHHLLVQTVRGALKVPPS